MLEIFKNADMDDTLYGKGKNQGRQGIVKLTQDIKKPQAFKLTIFWKGPQKRPPHSARQRRQSPTRGKPNFPERHFSNTRGAIRALPTAATPAGTRS